MSKIEWTGETWNPIVGCSVVSPGCKHCYAMKLAARIERMMPQLEYYRGLTQSTKAGPVWNGVLKQAPSSTLLEPMRRKKPQTYFVNSMSDLFHEAVPYEWIDLIFAVMALCPQHTFQVLTKRSARMREYCTSSRSLNAIAEICEGMRNDEHRVGPLPHLDGGERWYPLPNVWLGVSCEDQQRADERIPDLIETPAAVRFISAEPLLGPIEFAKVPGFNRVNLNLWNWWVIVGGESGRDARPMDLDWARSIRDQCQIARVPFFFKQHGDWLTFPTESPCLRTDGPGRYFARVDGRIYRGKGIKFLSKAGPDGPWAVRMGKKAAGRMLDGREWSEMPRGAAACGTLYFTYQDGWGMRHEQPQRPNVSLDGFDRSGSAAQRADHGS